MVRRANINMEDDTHTALCHPEILSHEKLVEVLLRRGLAKEELVVKDKDALVQLCYRFIVPLPQRATNMRRGNRLKKKLNPVQTQKSTDLEKEESQVGFKRKHPIIDVSQKIKAAKVSNFLHNTDDSPTTDCTQQILKLTVKLKPETPIKPVKLNRKCLTPNIHNPTKNNSITPNKLIPIQKKVKFKTVSHSKNSEESTSCDSQVESEEDKQFKRKTVTWP